MKGVLKFVIGAILGAALGWTAGFLRFPMVEKNQSFWLGFAAFAVLVLMVMGLLYLRNLNTRAVATRGTPTAIRPFVLVWMLVAVVFMGTVLFAWMLNRQSHKFATLSQAQEQKIARQAEQIAAMRNANLGVLIDDAIKKVDHELANDPQGKLSASTIEQIAALSYSLKPYRYFAGDTLADRSSSPERGQLLLALAHRDIDSVSFHQIKKTVTFLGADLREANLNGIDLSGVDLRGADLREANLKRASLAAADLQGANLWGARLDSANMLGVNLRRSNMEWVELNGANLGKANLNGVNLDNAKLRKVNMHLAVMQWGTARGAMLNEANLSRVDFLGTDFSMANLSNTNLTEANLKEADLTEAHLTGADLTYVTCAKDMLEKFDTWRIAEASQIQASYQVVDDTVRHYISAVFRMERIEKR